MHQLQCQKSPLSLKEGAIFISDAHYHPGLREELLGFLEWVDAPQIFFMGDIFDLLVGKVTFTKQSNKKAIDLLQKLSQKTQCFYLEGNHDFLLHDLFPQMQVFSRYNQPVMCQVGQKSVALAHGDIYIGGLYKFYIDLLHKDAIITTLNLMDIKGWISKKIQKYNGGKNLCKEIADFENIALQRLQHYDVDIVIEGHFHQRKIFTFGKQKYINLPSFGCSLEFLRYERDEFSFSRM
ncbi:UDP-2,3-diacylglucosamine diphosphatase [Nitratiruptor tergarcus]|uniref:UDP-2,3-diacylglucosamine hydrolase n=1 Tax=Nitratiruptor tergarcus DSM 16512 TaxID=1069081 RepID=A0A1W1WUY4_9BACT|nr:UDP-2,3-diacylglucosamine diphosphatase [Nitratiruptor tergarcus]SMC10025.1 UDP-2,3-diacylglucosamine hydrolase [Nitratiruptor tergarcus DSM 16512]